MKYLVITVLFVLFVCTGIAQPYQSIFGASTTKWTFKYNWLGQWNFVESAYFQKDTSVSGILYKKIVTHPSVPPWLIREDMASGSVWARYIKPYTVLGWEDTVEKLLFRMDLHVGDTFDIYDLGPQYAAFAYPDSLKVVDSIRTINGLKYIYFKGKAERYQSLNEPFTLIEGVGSNMGILWKQDGVTWGRHYLLCSYKDDMKTEYTNKYYDGDCDPALSIESYSTGMTIAIYPNPVVGVVNIQSQVPVTKLQLFDVAGKLVMMKTGVGISDLNVSGCNAGVYLLHICFDEFEPYVKQLIIQN